MVGTIICEVGTIICDIGTINVRFYLLEVRYLHGYRRITLITPYVCGKSTQVLGRPLPLGCASFYGCCIFLIIVIGSTTFKTKRHPMSMYLSVN